MASIIPILCAICIFLTIPTLILCFSKVLVPSFHREWAQGLPHWVTSNVTMDKLGYSVFLYQKLNPSEPNYIEMNRGGEAGVYLRYIVEHYHNFPDIAIFVHAHPEKHVQDWLEIIGCISPNATYYNFNKRKLCRPTTIWRGLHMEAWQEQCWRDVLRIVWSLDAPENQTSFNALIPPNKPIMSCFVCCNQFFISRAMIHRRPLAVWKKLYQIIGLQEACHLGEPDYGNLFAKEKLGPEPPNIAAMGESESNPGWGHYVQAMAVEHLAHVIFGFLPLDMPWPSKQEKCQNFLFNCTGGHCGLDQ